MTNPRRQVYVTLCNFGFAYMFIQLGYLGLESLQSTLNSRAGLGTTCVGVVNGCAVFSNLFIGPAVVQYLSPKRALFVSFLAHTLYIVANFYPTWETLLPVCVLVGITSSFIAIVYGVYLSSLSSELATLISAAGASGVKVEQALRSNESSHKLLDESLTGTLDKKSSDKSCYKINQSQSGSDDDVTKFSTNHAVIVSSKVTKAPFTERIFARFNSIIITFTTIGGLAGNLTSSFVLGMKRSVEITNGSHSLNIYQEFSQNSSAWNPTTRSTEKKLEAASRIGDEMSRESWMGNITDTSHKAVCGIDHCSPLIEEDYEMNDQEHQSDWSLVYTMLSIYLGFTIMGLVLSAMLRPVENKQPIEEEENGNISDFQLKTESNSDKTRSGRDVSCLACSETRPAFLTDTNEPSCCDVRSRELSFFDRSDYKKMGSAWCGTGVNCQSTVKSLTETIRLLARVDLLCLIVPQIWVGVIFSFTVGAFNQSFIGCSLGIAYIGYTMTSFRVVSIVSSLTFARLLQCVHRRYLVLFAMILQLLVILSWILVPSYESAVLLVTCCALIGCVFGVIRTVFYGIYPLLFADCLESALAHNSLWECLGLSTAFLINDRLCFRYQAYIIVPLTMLAIISYIILEVRIARRLREGMAVDGRDRARAVDGRDGARA